MSEQELKPLPCPFCGKEVYEVYQGSSDWCFEHKDHECPFNASFWVHGAKYGYGEGEHKEVIRRWNTRATSPEVERLVEALEEIHGRVDCIGQDMICKEIAEKALASYRKSTQSEKVSE